MTTTADKLEQMVLGSVFGDGHLGDPRGQHKNSFLDVSHHSPQGEYARWKMSVLQSLGVRCSYWETPLPPTPQHPVRVRYRFTTECLPVFTGYRRQFYTGGSKWVSRHLLNKLNELGLAIWYMDDGSLCLHWEKRKYPTLHRWPFLHTEGFGYGGNETVQRYFREEHGIETVIVRNSRKMPYLRFKLDGFHKLLAMIRPYVHSTMLYKVDLKYKQGSPHEQPSHNAKYPELASGNEIV